MRGFTQRHLQSQGKKYVYVCEFGIVPITSVTALCLPAVHVHVCSYPTAVSTKTCMSCVLPLSKTNSAGWGGV